MRILLLFSVALFGVARMQAQTVAAPVCSAPSVGFEVVTLGGKNVGVWYPSVSPETTYPYSDKVSGSVALNGTAAPCRDLPLVVFSHSFGGCGTQSVFITEQLARSGYIVAAPDHADAGCSVTGSGQNQPPPPQQPFGDPSTWTDQTYIDRRTDIENTIDGMLADAMLGRRIDPSRISGMGHSLGGYTMMAMAGGWPSWLDPRIKAVLLLSPYCQPFQVQKTVGNLHVPVLYQGGTLDIGITPFVAQPGGAYDQTAQPKYFAELKAAGHLAWTNTTCAAAGTIASCLNTVPNAALINSYGFAFFDHYARGLFTPLLWSNGPGLAAYRFDISSIEPK